MADTNGEQHHTDLTSRAPSRSSTEATPCVHPAEKSADWVVLHNPWADREGPDPGAYFALGGTEGAQNAPP